ncbi:hypothetical protein I312_100728 [Cryptococcus bacillisporus CA1280]|uniref:PXA domain-containing protein n=1 Tax=Cryptococcus bacillisporus CA1280 TaxID=1296109 RepID=A0A0D0VIQ6_CRYGA|nr:hypothetical protein I312_04413 [Cryptococcus bacillisporus CA1280]
MSIRPQGYSLCKDATSSSVPTLSQPPASARLPAHLPLYHRLLFPHHPLGEPLPQLVIGNGPEIDLLNERIYNLVALALRGYILSWYTRFSKDRTLLPSIHSTIIHPILSPILTSVYDDPERIVKWILRDLLSSVEIHVKVYWEAKAALGAGTLGDRYHARLPLPSVTASSSPAPYIPVDPTYTLSSEYLTSLSVALIQPTETEEERSQMGLQGLMIREVLARAILAGGMRRLCFGWFWYGLILKLLGEPGDPFPWRHTTPQKQDEPESLHQLVLSYMRAIITLFTTIYSAIVALIAVYTAAPPPSPEYEGCTDTLMGMMREMVGVDGYAGIEAKKWRKRMVWGGVEMAVGLTSPVLDRIIPHLLSSQLTPKLSFRLIDLAEKLLFPLDGYPGPTPIDPTPDEAADMRNKAEKRIGEIIPKPLRVVFCPEDKDVRRLMEWMADAGCNAHLVGMMLVSLVATLLPDLVDKTNSEDGQL